MSSKGLKSVSGKDVTTIWVHRTTKKLLDEIKGLDEHYDLVIQRLLMGLRDIFFDIIYIDGQYARSSNHDVIFQVGDNPPRFFRYINGDTTPLETLPKMEMKVSA